jgi:hypothetical protein
MTNSVGNFWARYQAEKKAATPVVDVITQERARSVSQRAAQEIAVLEKNLATYRAVSRRARPSMNARVSKEVKRDIDAALKIAESYISDYNRVYVAWKKLIKSAPKRRRVIWFPLSSTQGPKLVDALNAFFNKTIKWVENETIRKTNLPVLPHKSSVVNVRGKTIADAKHVKSVKNQLEIAQNLLTGQKKFKERARAAELELNRAKYELETVIDAKTRATKKWKNAQKSLKVSSLMMRMLRRNSDEQLETALTLQRKLCELRREYGVEVPQPRTFGQILGLTKNTNSNSNNDWAEKIVREAQARKK